MARQASDSRVVRPGRNSSAGAAVLDRAVPDTPRTQTMHLLQEEIARLESALQQGHLTERARVDSFQGSDRSVVESVNGMLDAVIGSLNASAGYVERISKGEVPPKITDAYPGDFNQIKNNLNAVIEVLNMRNLDVQKLVEASNEGKLDYRADPKKYTGENGKLMEAINGMLDAILLPIGEGNRILAQISAGKVDELIAQTYKGDHEKMKQAVNTVATVLQGLQKELARLTDASTRRATVGARQARAVPGHLRRDREGRQRHAGRHPGADRRRQPDSGANQRGQGGRIGRPELPW